MGYSVENNTRTLTNTVQTGTNCGSILYLKEDEELAPIYYLLEDGVISQEDFDQIVRTDRFQYEVRSPFPDVTTIEIYDGLEATVPLQTSSGFLNHISSLWENSVIIYGLNESTTESELNIYDEFHAETDTSYYIVLTLEDDSTIELIIQNGLIHNISNDSYMYKGGVTLGFFDYFHYEIQNQDVMSHIESYIVN